MRLSFLFVLLFCFSSIAQGGNDAALREHLLHGLHIPPKESEKFAFPTPEDKELFQKVVHKVFVGQTEGLGDDLRQLGIHGDCWPNREDCQYVILRGDPAGRYLGTYVFRTTAKKNLIIQAPHPLFDSGSDEVAIDMFLDLQARGLFIAGTHRNANTDTLDCDIPVSRDKPYRISDVAHSPKSWFQVAHEKTVDLDPKTYFISVHGFGKQEDFPYHIVVSDGTNFNGAAANISRQFAQNINDKFGGDVAKSCNDGTDQEIYCGLTNIQGRYINDSTDVCLTDATRSNDRFIHLEMSKDVRRYVDKDATRFYENVVSALEVTVPDETTLVIPPAHKIRGVPTFRQGKNLCGPTASSMIAAFYGEPQWTQYTIARDIYDLPDDFDWDDYRYTYRGRLVTFFKEKFSDALKYEGEDGMHKMRFHLARNRPVISRAYFSGTDGARHYRAHVGYDDFNGEVIYNESSFETLLELDEESSSPSLGSGSPPSDPQISRGLADMRVNYAKWRDMWTVGGDSPSKHYMIVPMK